MVPRKSVPLSHSTQGCILIQTVSHGIRGLVMLRQSYEILGNTPSRKGIPITNKINDNKICWPFSAPNNNNYNKFRI